METTEVSTEFRYLLFRLGRQLHPHDCEGLMFVHKIPDVHGTKSDIGLHVLSSLEDMGCFDPTSPDKLQETLNKIGRKDLANDIEEYKQSAEFKKAAKLEDSKRKSKRGKDYEKRGAFAKRCVAAKLLTGAENCANEEEGRRWRDMFSMALNQTAQLVEQAELLRRAIEAHDDSKQANRSMEEALHAILTAKDELESLSKTLKTAVAAAGLKLRGDSGENILDPTEPEGSPAAEAKKKKKAVHPLQSPKLERANSFDGTGRSKVTKAAVLRTSSLCASAAAHTPIGLTPISTARSAGHAPIPTVPIQAPPTSVLTPNPTPFPSADTPTTNPTPSSPMPTPAPTYAIIAPRTPTRSTSLTPNPTPNPTPSTLTTVNHKEGPPEHTTFPSTPNPVPNPISTSSTPTSSPNSTPTAITTAKLKLRPATSPKPKPSMKIQDFHRKLDSLLAGATPNTTNPSTTNPHTAITHSNTFPSFNALHSTTTATTTELTNITPSPDFDEGHIYDDSNLSKEDESGGLYQNIQTVCSSVEYQNAKSWTKRESEISIQVDSGLGAEDKSWGGELVNMKGKPQYMNLPILQDPGLLDQPAEYTALHTKR